jgi:hypothetical protein
VIQPGLPIGSVPRDDALRRALFRLAARVEGDGPAGLSIDATTAPGRAAWRDVERALDWIYGYPPER